MSLGLTRILPVLGVAALALSASHEAASFTTYPEYYLCAPGPDPCEWTGSTNLDLQATLEQALRWDASPEVPVGLADGISVGVGSGFAASLGAETPADVEAVREAVRSAFITWETSELYFKVEFDQIDLIGFEIALEAVGADHYAFRGTTFTGMTWIDWDWFDPDRILTNGDAIPGFSLGGVQIFINKDMFEILLGALTRGGNAPEDADLLLLQNVLTHEIGHAIGLGHPNQYAYANFDSDLDPMTPVVVDPNNPFANLIVSPNVDVNVMMWGGFPANIESFFTTELRPDDIAGLEVLYPSPVPEPSSSMMLVSVGLALSVLSRRQRARAGRRARRFGR